MAHEGRGAGRTKRQPNAQSLLTEAMRHASKQGYGAMTVCLCGNERDFTFDTDSMTGSSYARCRVCHRIHPFQGAWHDHALGMNFASWWTQKYARGFVVE